MPRIKRVLSDNHIYHVLNRGNGRQQVFHNQHDYEIFIRLMKEAKKKIPLKILAYCLMPNHFHLVLLPEKGRNLSQWMQWLMTSHVRYHHRLYQTSSHIWQGRFKSFLVQEDDHLLTVIRYVERNPVTANLVRSAKDWPWSSHEKRLSALSSSLIDSFNLALPNNWSDHVDMPFTQKELEKIRLSLNRQSPFGSAAWQETIVKKLGLESTLNPRGRPKKSSLSPLFVPFIAQRD